MEQNKENTYRIALPQAEGIMLHLDGLGITLPQLTQAIAEQRQQQNPALCFAAIQSKLARDLVAPVTIAFLQESLEALGYRLTLKLDQVTEQKEKSETQPTPDAKPSSQSARIKDLLNRPIEDLMLMVRSRNCLHAGNVFYIGQLVQLSEAQLLKFMNIGKHTVKDIVGQLEKFALKLDMKIVGWNPPFDQALLDKEISHLNLSTRASASLKSIGVFYIGDLVQIPQKKLYVDDAISQRCYEEIAKQVESAGLQFGMVVPDWKRPA